MVVRKRKEPNTLSPTAWLEGVGFACASWAFAITLCYNSLSATAISR